MCADKGFAPIYAGHEPVMLLLHQSAFNAKYTSKSVMFYLRSSLRGFRTPACDSENVMS